MSRERVLSNAAWERIAPLIPSSVGVKSRPFRDYRQVVEGVIYRFHTGIAWRDIPASFGPWQTVRKRHHRFSTDGAWDKIHARLLAEADAVDEIDRMVSVDSTINWAHQHATNASRVEQPAGDSRAARSARVAARGGGRFELHESVGRATRPCDRTLPRRPVDQDLPARRRPRATAGHRAHARSGR